MASEGGGKIRPKKNQNPRKPYERNTSLFGKLKSSVKDLLIPSWLSSAPSVKEGDGEKAQTLLHAQDDVVSCSVGMEGSGWTGSGLHRERNLQPSDSMANSCVENIPGRQTHALIPDFGLPSQNGEVYQELSPTRIPVGPSHKFSLSFDDKKSEPALIETPDRPHHYTTLDIERGDYETLRLSRSLTKDREYEKKRSVPLQPVMVSTGAGKQSQNLLADHEKVTLSPDALRQGRPLIPPARGKPVFNSLLFGTPSKTEPSSSLSDSFGESLFYAGKTKYGGASAARRKNLNSSLPYQSSLPLRKQVRAKRLNSSLNATTSATARRILDTLDHMSGPLEDGKKSTQDGFGNDSVLSFTPSSYRRSMFETSRRPPARPLQLPNRGPSTSQLMNTSRAEISFNRNKPMIRSNEGQDSLLSVSQEHIEVSEQDEPANKMSSVPKTPASFGNTGKMKTKKFSQHVSKGEDENVCESPLLRTDFKLPVSSLNPINFATPSSVAFSSTTGSKSLDKSYPVFTFSTPVPIQSKCHPSFGPVGSPMSEDFTFSTPVQASSIRTCAAGAEEGSKYSLEPAIGASSVRVWKPCASPKPKTISPDIGGTSSSFESYTKWSSNKKTDNSASFNGSPGFGIPTVATSLKEGSVMDILGDGKNSSSSSIKKDGAAMSSPASISSSVGFPTSSTGGNTHGESSSAFIPLSALFKKPPGAWDCQTCLIQNAKEALHCVACETPKASTKPTAPVQKANSASNSSIPLSELFKKPPGSWDCDTCLIRNDSTTTKCVACETPRKNLKQGSIDNKSTTTIAGNSSSVPLSELFKKPSGSWDCDTCMILNDPGTTKCVACETPRKTSKQALPGNQDSSGGNINNNIPLSELFKKPPGSWDCDTCLIRNNANTMKCVACETPKPGPKQAVPDNKVSSASSSNSIPLSELFKKPTGSWNCDTCLVSNNSEVIKCVACETPRPGPKQTPAASPKKVDNSLSSMFKRPEGSWVCDTCYVVNTSTILRCVACDSPKPGLQSAGVESVTPSSSSAIQFQPGGGFTFNLSMTATSSAGTGGFKFGNFGASTKSTTVTSSSCVPTAEQKPSQPAGGFTFGNFTSSVSSSTINFGSTIPKTATKSPSEFSSGSQSDSKLNAESGSPVKKKMGVSTGIVQPSSNSSNPLQKSNNLFSSTGGFQFGSSRPTPNTTFPSINKMSDSTTSAQSNFMLEATPTNNVQSSTISKEQKPNVETKAAPVFNFGAPVSSQNSGTAFNFGVSSTTVAPVLNGGFGSVFNKDSEPQKTSNSSTIRGITFGGASNPACDTKGPTPSDGFNFMAKPAVASHSGFQFSGNSMTEQPSLPGFSFTAGSDKNANPSVNKSNNNGSISFKPTPNFNFASSGSDGATSGIFQFGAPSATATSASSVFQFGSSAPQLDVPQPSAPSAFGASPALPFGSGNTAPRKMKRAVRRIKKPQ